MKTKKSIGITKVLTQEIIWTKGADKFLLIALLCNIPSPIWFVPYLTQAMTVIILILYLKSKGISSLSKLSLLFVIAAVIIQVPIIWMPFATQISTIVLVGLIYISSHFIGNNPSR